MTLKYIKMQVTAKITGIKYKVICSPDLTKIEFTDFDINEAPSSCIVTDNNHSYAISKWVSPKRTRSYPYERVYNTLNFSKKITVIPIIKDEGAKGDRDFIQWDTVSLMSLLDIFVIFAFYNKADKIGNKITNQQFDNQYILEKIKEISQYHSSALHWNLNELNMNLHDLIDKSKNFYDKIEKETNVKLHKPSGIERFKNKIGKDLSLFILFSREKSENAQAREFITIQPKESLATLTKAKITIMNYLGGKYFFTVDEIDIAEDAISLIESKHSKNSILPSKGDIKDGLLKMILYSNISEVDANSKLLKSKAILNLTSVKLEGIIGSESSVKEITEFFISNKFSETQIEFIENLFKEANENQFTVILKNAQ
jgi:hypothetical protein